MKIINDDMFSLNPVRKYEAPRYPIYTEAIDNPMLLKKIPSRWQKNTRVITCLGFMGTLSLTGCILGLGSTCPTCGYPHLGGSGGAPIYIVYLTEQEAIELMREKGEAAGLDFSAEPPDYSIGWGGNIGINLFDENKKVGFSLINNGETGWNWCDQNKGYVSWAKEEFNKLDNEIEVGVFYNPEERFGSNEATDQEKKEALELLKEKLNTQVHEFIEWLQAQGIIQ